MNNRISVVIPCYNGERFLPLTLASVLEQTYRPCEVLVVDDGSTDGSAAIADSFDSLVRVVHQENQGESVARNRGIDEAVGDWVAFVDADDLWHPRKLEEQVERMAPDVVGVATEHYVFHSDEGAPDYGRKVPVDCSLVDVALSSPLHMSSLVVRRALSPRFPTWTNYGEDLVYCLELMLVGRIEIVHQVLCGYRRHQHNQSRNSDISVHWHETVEKWIDMRRDALSPVDVDAIRTGWIDFMSKGAMRAYLTRDWPLYWKLRRHLEARGALKDRALRRRPYPPWAYVIKDRLFPPKRRAD